MNETTYTAEGLRGMISDVEARRYGDDARDLTEAEIDHLTELYGLLDEVEG
jgi:hypothetical protein